MKKYKVTFYHLVNGVKQVHFISRLFIKPSQLKAKIEELMPFDYHSHEIDCQTDRWKEKLSHS